MLLLCVHPWLVENTQNMATLGWSADWLSCHLAMPKATIWHLCVPTLCSWLQKSQARACRHWAISMLGMDWGCHSELEMAFRRAVTLPAKSAFVLITLDKTHEEWDLEKVRSCPHSLCSTLGQDLTHVRGENHVPSQHLLVSTGESAWSPLLAAWSCFCSESWLDCRQHKSTAMPLALFSPTRK
jgi:hypothetical protein